MGLKIRLSVYDYLVQPRHGEERATIPGTRMVVDIYHL
jgi:hypothetical protein